NPHSTGVCGACPSHSRGTRQLSSRLAGSVVLSGPAGPTGRTPGAHLSLRPARPRHLTTASTPDDPAGLGAGACSLGTRPEPGSDLGLARVIQGAGTAVTPQRDRSVVL